jgi:hypothetical protein
MPCYRRALEAGRKRRYRQGDTFLVSLQTLDAKLEVFRTLVQFLQDNGLARRTILAAGEQPTCATEVWASDLTEEGHRLVEAIVRHESPPPQDVGELERLLAKCRGSGADAPGKPSAVASGEEAAVKALERFGRDVVVNARDRVLEEYDLWLASAPRRKPRPQAAPEVQQRDADDKAIATLPAELQALIRRVAVRSVDGAIHHMLWRLSQEFDFDKATLTFDGVEVLGACEEAMAWNGIYWGIYTDEGWYARFSKFGEDGKSSALR